MGPDLEVMEPASLREEYATTARELARKCRRQETAGS
jgi:hypothetical protein